MAANPLKLNSSKIPGDYPKKSVFCDLLGLISHNEDIVYVSLVAPPTACLSRGQVTAQMEEKLFSLSGIMTQQVSKETISEHLDPLNSSTFLMFTNLHTQIDIEKCLAVLELFGCFSFLP